MQDQSSLVSRGFFFHDILAKRKDQRERTVCTYRADLDVISLVSPNLLGCTVTNFRHKWFESAGRWSDRMTWNAPPLERCLPTAADHSTDPGPTRVRTLGMQPMSL